MLGFMGALCVIGIGGFVGAMLGLTIDPTGNGLWIFGALCGGAVAYAGYDYKETWKAMVFVFKAPWKKIIMTPLVFAYSMVSSGRLYKYVALHATTPVVLLLDVCVFLAIVSWKLNGANIMIHDVRTQFVPTGSIILAVSMLYGLLIGLGTWTVSEDKVAEQVKVVRSVLVYGNPLAILIYWPYVAIKNLWKIAKMIHNDVRVFCFVCASMGATTGWYLGHDAPWLPHPLAALAGALFGIVLAALMHAVMRTTPIASKS